MTPISHKVYSVEYHSIGVVFNTDDPLQDELFRAFKRSFEERFVLVEDIEPPRYRFVDLLPGGLQEVQR